MKQLFVIFLALLTVWAASAQYNYADISVSVSDAGKASFTGITNYGGFDNAVSDNFTSKQGKYWVLNISEAPVFSDFVFEISLPENSVITYIKAPSLSRIDYAASRPVIVVVGENEPVQVVVQYYIKESRPLSYPYIIAGLVVLAILGYALYTHFKKKPNVSKNIYLTVRQKIILDKFSKETTQAELEKLTGFPKSSLSRNLDTLEKKGVIEKQKRGMTNIIVRK